MIVLLPVLVAIIGILCYALATNPKVAELGRIAYFCGLLVFLLSGAQQLIGLLGR
jgi:hypothetical protein